MKNDRMNRKNMFAREKSMGNIQFPVIKIGRWHRRLAVVIISTHINVYISMYI